MRRPGRLQHGIDRGSEWAERTLSLDGHIKNALGLKLSPLEWLWRGLIVTTLTALWGFAAYLMPRLYEMGWYVMALAGLAGAVLTMAAAVFLSWAISTIRGHWHPISASNAPRERDSVKAQVDPSEPERAGPPSSATVAQPTLYQAEQPDDPKAKHKLATFASRYVLPACDAQEALQLAALRKVCGGVS